MGEQTAPDGRMRGNSLAHAEMDVLAQLPLGDYSRHVLYSSLEPCLLCRSAATMTSIGEVRYLATDSLCDGLERIPEINDHAHRRYPRMIGPSEGDLSFVAQVLPLAVIVLLRADSVEHYRAHAPAETAAADRIVADGLWPRRSESLDEIVQRLGALQG